MPSVDKVPDVTTVEDLHKEDLECRTPLYRGHCLLSQLHRAVYKTTSELGTSHTAGPVSTIERLHFIPYCLDIGSSLVGSGAALG